MKPWNASFVAELLNKSGITANKSLLALDFKNKGMTKMINLDDAVYSEADLDYWIGMAKRDFFIYGFFVGVGCAGFIATMIVMYEPKIELAYDIVKGNKEAKTCVELQNDPDLSKRCITLNEILCSSGNKSWPSRNGMCYVEDAK